MKRIHSALAAVVVAAAVTAPGASAATIYEHINDGGATQGAYNMTSLGLMNDKVSSLRTYGRTVVFCEHANYTGSMMLRWADTSDLRSYKMPLAPTLSWNYPISSWRTR